MLGCQEKWLGNSCHITKKVALHQVREKGGQVQVRRGEVRSNQAFSPLHIERLTALFVSSPCHRVSV